MQSNPASHPQNQKGKKNTHMKDTHSKPNEQLFPIQVVIQQL